MRMTAPTKQAMTYLWLILILILIPSTLFFFMTNKTLIIHWTLVTIMSCDISFPLIIDPTGLAFSSTVIFISANIMQFSDSYMKGDPFIKRFIHLVLLFVLSMNLLIFIPHLMFLLLGWDGLGITSFILVIYYQNPKSLAAGMITALTNRIGDVLILISIAWTLNQGHWLIINMNLMTPLITIAITLAAMTKSAQIPFSSWLPAAMAAPTPVSALVHSSTLVTAGVFLLIRFYPALSSMKYFHQTLLLVASLTMFMAGLSAMMESDMKKIIALSTLSQLGVMMASLGMQMPKLALFHLMTHALFKALLFICAGTLITLSPTHSQDLRSMGTLTNQAPLLLSSMTIANLALCGSPFLAGFYSKDTILEMSTSNHNNIIILALLFSSTALTSIYSMRFMLSLIWSPSLHPSLHKTNNKDVSSSIPAIALTSGAISGGALLNWILFSPQMEPTIPTQFKILAPMTTAFGAWIAWLNIANPPSKSKAPTLYYALSLHTSSSMWFLTPLSSQFIMKFPLQLAHSLLKVMDHGWNEVLGGQGALTQTKKSSQLSQLWQSNMITTHLSMMVATMIPLIMLI